jgi:hypothetical protein
VCQPATDTDALHVDESDVEAIVHPVDRESVVLRMSARPRAPKHPEVLRVDRGLRDLSGLCCDAMRHASGLAPACCRRGWCHASASAVAAP